MYTSQTTKFPGGLSNCAPGQTMHASGVPDPSWSQLYHNDFNNFAAADFTQSGLGAPTYSLNNSYGPGGVVTLNTDATLNDTANLFQPVGSFQLTPLKHQFFKTRLQVPVGSAAAAIYAGLSINAATAIGASDGLFFYKAAGQSNFVLRSTIGGVSTDTPLPAACAVADGAWVELGFHVDQQGNVEAFFNPTTGNNQPNVNNGTYRGRVASAQGLALTQQLLAVCAGIVNGTAAARTLAIDYLTMSSER